MFNSLNTNNFTDESPSKKQKIQIPKPISYDLKPKVFLPTPTYPPNYNVQQFQGMNSPTTFYQNQQKQFNRNQFYPTVKREQVPTPMYLPPLKTNSYEFQNPVNFEKNDVQQMQDYSPPEITIVEGFISNPVPKQSGGRENKVPLPKHILRISIPKYETFRTFSLEALLIGKKTNQQNAEIDLLEKSKSFPPGDFSVIFENMTVHFASHNYGQRFHLRFNIKDDTNGQIVSTAETEKFETITRRGKEKQRRKEACSVVPEFFNIQPPFAFNSKSSVIKITGQNFFSVAVLYPDNFILKFGNEQVKILMAESNLILCESPICSKVGEVKVTLKVPGNPQVVESCYKFKFLEKSENAFKEVKDYFFKEAEEVKIEEIEEIEE
eukprot:gene35-4286_t